MANELTKRIMANMVARCGNMKTFEPGSNAEHSNKPQDLHLNDKQVQTLTGLIRKDKPSSPRSQARPAHQKPVAQKKETSSYVSHQERLKEQRAQSLNEWIGKSNPGKQTSPVRSTTKSGGAVKLQDFIRDVRK